MKELSRKKCNGMSKRVQVLGHKQHRIDVTWSGTCSDKNVCHQILVSGIRVK